MGRALPRCRLLVLAAAMSALPCRPGAMPAVRHADQTRRADPAKAPDQPGDRGQPRLRPADPARPAARAPRPCCPTDRAASAGMVSDLSGRAMVGSAVVRGEAGPAVRIDLPSRIELYSLSGGRITIDDIVSDLPAGAKLDSAGTLSIPIRRAAAHFRRCRGRISRRRSDHGRVFVNKRTAENRSVSDKTERAVNQSLEQSRKRTRLMRHSRVTQPWSGQPLTFRPVGNTHMTLLRTTAAVAALALTATPAFAAPVGPTSNATATARIVKPLTLTWVQDLDLGTIAAVGAGAWARRRRRRSHGRRAQLRRRQRDLLRCGAGRHATTSAAPTTRS